jgi:hypothetical protein
MHPPQRVQPVRSGPSPSKKGSGAVSPGSPKYTPTVCLWNVSPRPISPATSRSRRSVSTSTGLSTAPSIFFAVA